MSKVSTNLFKIAESRGIDLSEVKYDYTYFPNWDQTYFGTTIKSNWLHSLWVGLVMPIINTPMMLWTLLIKPVGVVLGMALFGVILFYARHLFGGLMGNASGIVVDKESFNEAVSRSMQQDFNKMMESLKNQFPDATIVDHTGSEPKIVHEPVDKEKQTLH